MIQILTFISIFAFLFVILPCVIGCVIGLCVGYARGTQKNWREVSWASSGLLPEPQADMPATVIILSSKTGQWRGFFADHLAIVLKRAGEAKWTRYEVVGWGKPIRKDNYAADALWFGNAPNKIYELQGEAAEALIPRIEANIAAYPYQKRGHYVAWPGPNSNSFVAWVVRHTAGFDVELPAVAVGKDYLGPGIGFGPAASHTGYMFSIAGYFGMTIAREEGIELNFLGNTIGIDFNDRAIKLPALGKLRLSDLWA